MIKNVLLQDLTHDARCQMRSDMSQVVALVEDFMRSHSLPASYVYAHISESQLFPIEVVPVEDVAPLVRGPDVHGIDRERAYAILEDIFRGVPLHPVNVYRKENKVGSAGPKFQLYHGYHRYCLSIAIGFTHIPVAINPAQD